MTNTNTHFTRIKGTRFTRILRIGREYPSPFLPTIETYSAHGAATFTVQVSSRNVGGSRAYSCEVVYGGETILGNSSTRTSLLSKLQRYCDAVEALTYGLRALSR